MERLALIPKKQETRKGSCRATTALLKCAMKLFHFLLKRPMSIIQTSISVATYLNQTFDNILGTIDAVVKDEEVLGGGWWGLYPLGRHARITIPVDLTGPNILR